MKLKLGESKIFGASTSQSTVSFGKMSLDKVEKLITQLAKKHKIKNLSFDSPFEDSRKDWEEVVYVKYNKEKDFEDIMWEELIKGHKDLDLTV